MKISNELKLIFSILICQFAGVIGGLFTGKSIATWYQYLHKPEFNPPSIVFAPVWTILYTLMGISLFLVLKDGFKTPEKIKALTFFGIQLILNTSWSIVFFGFKSIFGALIIIVILWIFILLTVIRFYNISRIAAILLFPYLLWVSFAILLNYSLWKLNL